MKEILLPLLAGCATGILSAWGVGGGTLLLLIMTLFLGVDPAAARAVNLLYFLPTAAMGLLTYRKEGLLERPVLTAAVPWGMVAAAVGAWLSTALDADHLRRPFGVFLLVAGGMTLARKENGRSFRRESMLKHTEVYHTAYCILHTHTAKTNCIIILQTQIQKQVLFSKREPEPAHGACKTIFFFVNR